MLNHSCWLIFLLIFLFFYWGSYVKNLNYVEMPNFSLLALLYFVDCTSFRIVEMILLIIIQCPYLPLLICLVLKCVYLILIYLYQLFLLADACMIHPPPFFIYLLLTFFILYLKFICFKKPKVGFCFSSQFDYLLKFVIFSPFTLI